MIARLAVLLWMAAAPAFAATLDVGEGKAYALPSQAAAAAKDGDTVRIAAGTYRDCAAWRANNLTIEGAGADTTVITEKTCQGKGLFITYGNGITIRGMTFSGARVPDFNGAGIRAEGGDLTLERVRFVDNQDGILSNPSPSAHIVIRDSEFLQNGTCEGSGGCSHGVYVGTVALLHIESTRFFETRQGHHIKSRARRTEVIGCDISDGAKGTSSYAIEIANGGSALVRDNRIQKGPRSENHSAAVAVGAEGVTQATPEIIVANNTFLVEGQYQSFLVRNLTATEATLTGNTLLGNARALRGEGTVR